MTCKDCIHCRPCHEMWLIAVSQEDDFFERNDAETCEDFKNKSDYAEVVHGEWAVNVGMNFNKERICPICKKKIEGNYWNYCSNCGAKMDGGKAEL